MGTDFKLRRLLRQGKDYGKFYVAGRYARMYVIRIFREINPDLTRSDVLRISSENNLIQGSCRAFKNRGLNGLRRKITANVRQYEKSIIKDLSAA